MKPYALNVINYLKGHATERIQYFELSQFLTKMYNGAQMTDYDIRHWPPTGQIILAGIIDTNIQPDVQKVIKDLEDMENGKLIKDLL